MESFTNFYEKTLNIGQDEIKTDEDKICIDMGHRLANRFGLKLNGWWEMLYTFTIPKGFPNEKNTFLARNELEIISNLEKKFPEYLEFIMNKNFPDGYEPDLSIPENPPKECQAISQEQMRRENQ